jgi:acyl-CoA synthetase (AMP-forming)/AMP-acid ligase II/thioesterase domain-containing protein/acyl carrier protein
LAESNGREAGDRFAGECIYSLLAACAERHPDAPAILAPGRSPLSYGRLFRHVADVVAQLNSTGLQRGDRVAIVLPNGPEMAVAFLAVAAGMTGAPLNPAYRGNEFDYYLSDLNAGALVVQSGIDSPARAVARARNIPIIELVPRLDAEAGMFSLENDTGSGARMAGFARSDDIALVLHTSGTTSRPKIVPLMQSNICTSAGNIMRTLALGGNDRCLNVMPLFHIHGLVAALLSTLAAGGSIVCTPGFYAPQFFGWLETFTPTWYSAVPTMHQAILARAASSRGIIEKSPLRFLRSSSAALPPQVMAELESVFSASVIEAYGMTEAAHQMASNPLPPRKRKPGSVGLAAGPEVAIMDGAGTLLPSGETGEIVIRGPNVMQGYENNPKANETAFANGWFRTGDQGYMDGEGYVFVTGRLKEIINRGGEKISPREVDEALMNHPAVAQAVTFAFPDPKLGEEIGAAIVVREGYSATDQEIREFASARLADFKVPRRVVIVDEIPKGPTGKLQRIGLAEQLGIKGEDDEASALRPPFVAPRNQAEETLARIWAQVLDIEQIGVHDDFFSLGGDSMLAARIFARIEEEFGRALPLGALIDAPTVEKLADILSRDEWSPRWSYLVAIQPRGARRPLFCVHPLSGNVLAYTDLARRLGSDQPFYALQAPGLAGNQPPGARFEDMAAEYLDEIMSVDPDGPYLLGGASATGGLIAFEIAQQLRARGKEIGLMVLIDVMSPPALQPRSKKAPGHRDSLLRYPRRYFRRRITAVKQWIANDAQTRRFRRVERANERARGRYTPAAYPGRIVLFMSEEGPSWPSFDPQSPYGWGALAGGGLDFYLVPGNHAGILREPHVRLVAEKMRFYLDRANQCIR